MNQGWKREPHKVDAIHDQETKISFTSMMLTEVQLKRDNHISSTRLATFSKMETLCGGKGTHANTLATNRNPRDNLGTSKNMRNAVASDRPSRSELCPTEIIAQRAFDCVVRKRKGKKGTFFPSKFQCELLKPMELHYSP